MADSAPRPAAAAAVPGVAVGRYGVSDELAPLVVLFEAYRAFYACAPSADAAAAFLTARLAGGDAVVYVACICNSRMGRHTTYANRHACA